MSELALLKSQLRSLVVSSPTAVDTRTLLRDYRNLMGEALPITRHGYRDPVQFLRERCGDCFLLQGPSCNPVLTLIVPDQLKHIDEFVQKQKMPSTNRRIIKPKRRSIPDSYINPPRDNLISRTFIPPLLTDPPIAKPYQNSVSYPKSEPRQPERQQPKQSIAEEKPEFKHKEEPNVTSNGTERLNGTKQDRESDAHDGSLYSRRVMQRFLQKRTPQYSSHQLSDRALSKESLADDDSGRQTSSSTSSSKQAALDRLQAEVTALVAARPAGVPASQLMGLYEERYGRELNYSRLGFASISACACALDTLSVTRSEDGEWLVRARDDAAHGTHGPHGAHSPAPPALRVRRLALASSRGSLASLQPVDPDEALPGIDYDSDVFPADCLSFVESVPGASVADVAPGDMLALVVGEVYSPSHLWILRLGPDYDKMEDIMDEMTEYYTKGAGVDRVLAAGARRPGQYCSSVYDGDWHRSLIVQLVDTDTVKVRHVDYGTVDTVAARSLRPLRREWGALPAMAVRARLAGVRPPAAGRQWPRPAAQHCLRLVRDKRLVGNVVAVDHEEGIVELFLIDTSTAEDVNISDEMVRAGHADPRLQPALGASETYLLPLFSALESGATLNYAEIHAAMRDGISLECVEAYRRHVPALLPPAEPEPAPPAPRPAAPRPQPLVNRVPLPWASRAVDLTPPASDIVDTADLAEEPERTSPEPVAPPPVAAAPVVASEQVSSSPKPVSVVTPVTTAVAAPASPAPEPAPAPAPPAPEPAPAPASPASVPALMSIRVSIPASPPVSAAPASACASRPPAPPPAHPAAFYASPAYYPCPMGRACPPHYHPGSPFAQFRPPPPPPRPPAYFPPAPHYYRPAPPPPAPLHDVGLTASEYEIFQLLSLVDKNAAHRYVSEALRRALQAPAPGGGDAGAGGGGGRPAPAPLNPLAAEFRVATGTQTPMRPPPGFEHAHPPPHRR